MFWKALKTAAALSALFLVVYNGCSYVTSLRSGVGTWYYAWERYIPFVPIFIVPYMSIDLFFMAAPFVCRSDGERRLFARRIALAILLGGVCFLVYPLKLAVERPHVSGLLGAIYNPFCGVDRPFNLLPSLHIALRTIVAELYGRHTRGPVRLASHVWFSLIGFSTLLVWQHHVVDVIGGFLLAGVCFYAVRPAPLALPVLPNLRVGARYCAGAVAALALAVWLRPWGLWLVWPAAALALVTAGYCGLGPGVYAKHDGRLPLAARLMMWPVLLGQHGSLWYYKRRARRWDALAPGVWIGRTLNDAEAREAMAAGVTAVLDLTCEFSEAEPFLRLPYLNFRVLDLTAPTSGQVRAAVEFIESHSRRGIVYVHCKIGYSRTAAVAGAWLIHAGRARTAAEAMAMLRAARPTIVIRPEAGQVLRRAQSVPPVVVE